MNELMQLIDQNIEDLYANSVYQFYFSGIELVKDDDVFYLTNNDKDLELVISEDKIITTVFIYGNQGGTHKAFDGLLPLDIKFSFSRTEIHRILGSPYKSGGGHEIMILGRINVWDKYISDNCTVRFEYTVNEQEVVLVTIGSLSLEKRFNI